MQKSLIAFILLWCSIGSALASCPNNPSDCGPLVAKSLTVSKITYDARSYGSCTWDSSHDVGSCINLAIASAGSAGGGTVEIPTGEYGVSTTISNTTSGVRLIGQGGGIPRANNSPGDYLATTKLTWIGAADGVMLTVYAGSGLTLYNVDVMGIVFNCANLAGVCAHFTNVTYSNFAVGSSEPRSVGIWFDTAGDNTTPGPGNQWNDMWLYSRSTSPSNTYSPTGILLDQGAGSNWNTSFNRIHILSAWTAQGDGIVLASSDNNTIDQLLTALNPGNATGRPIVFSSSGYTMPNGLTVNGLPYDSAVSHLAGPTADVQGFQSGSTITQGVHTGTGAINTISLTTNGTTSAANATLNFAATTNVLAGMSINCGGYSSGVMTNSQVSSVTSTTVVMRQGAVGAVSSSQACVFGYGITNSAVAGTYTLTAVDATHWSITAPSGGHSQSNIALASGAVTFTDMVIPFTGTPNANDTFIVVVPSPARNLTLQLLDRANSAQPPILETGANYWLTTTQNPYPTPYGGSGIIAVNAVLPSGSGGVSIGPVPAPNGSGQNAIALGGFGVVATGFGAFAGSGHNTLASGVYSAAFGESSAATGPQSIVMGEGNLADAQSARAAGSNGTTRTRYLGDVWGAGAFSVQGDAQIFSQPLSAATTDATVTRLTADRLAAGASNIVNLVPHSTYRVSLECNAHQTGGSSGTRDDSAMWTATVLVKQAANAAATTFVGGYYVAITTLANTAVVAGTGFTPTISDAAAATWTITLNADTTNGGLLISGTGQANKNIEWLCRASSVELVN